MSLENWGKFIYGYHYNNSEGTYLLYSRVILVNNIVNEVFWIDRYTLEHHPRLLYMFSDWNNNDYINGWCRERAAKNTEQGENPMQRHPYHPAYLYEAGIDGITRLPIAGVIWYQGESNEQNVELHEVLFPTLVESWREAWKIDLPFYYVQLLEHGGGPGDVGAL